MKYIVLNSILMNYSQLFLISLSFKKDMHKQIPGQVKYLTYKFPSFVYILIYFIVRSHLNNTNSLG